MLQFYFNNSQRCKKTHLGWCLRPLVGCLVVSSHSGTVWHSAALWSALLLRHGCQHAGGRRAQRHGAGTRRHQEQYISGNTALPIKYEGLTLNSALARAVFMLYTLINNVWRYQNFGRGSRHGVGARRHGRLRRLLPNPPCCPSSPNLQEETWIIRNSVSDSERFEEIIYVGIWRALQDFLETLLEESNFVYPWLLVVPTFCMERDLSIMTQYGLAFE